MRRNTIPAMLTTSQVARLCGTNESTIQYAARVGSLPGTKVGGRWLFTAADAARYRDALLARKRGGASRRRVLLAGVGRELHKVIALLHLLGTIVSLQTAVGDGQASWIGWPLGALNLLAAGWEYARWRRTEPSEDDWVDGQPVDRQAVGLHVPPSPHGSWKLNRSPRPDSNRRPFGMSLQGAIIAATVLYVANPEALFTLFGGGPGSDTLTIASTVFATDAPNTTPSVAPPFETPPPTEPGPPGNPEVTATSPSIVPSPTGTAEPTVEEPSVTPSPDSTLTPTPCDVDGCPDVIPSVAVIGETVAAAGDGDLAPPDDGQPTTVPVG